MANSPQARKRARQAERNRRHNMSYRSMIRTLHKKVEAALSGKDKTIAAQAYTAFAKQLDKMVSKNILHRNKAARLKSRLNARLKAL